MGSVGAPKSSATEENAIVDSPLENMLKKIIKNTTPKPPVATPVGPSGIQDLSYPK